MECFAQMFGDARLQASKYDGQKPKIAELNSSRMSRVNSLDIGGGKTNWNVLMKMIHWNEF